ncbi:MAG TPA: hypothetical protein VIL20_17295 [Sandaracinaceae bacterium]
MPTWAYWALFFVVSGLAIAAAKHLDDRERGHDPEKRLRTTDQT